MSAYKDQTRGTWTAQVSYKDWKGVQKHTCKRGFATKREALQWEQEYLNKVRDRTDMLFRDYAEVYLRNRENRIREGTMQIKTNIIYHHLVPYFGDKKLIDITTQDIMNWQNEVIRTINPRTGKPFTKSYLKTIHNVLSAMLNHAVKYYDLPKNAAMLVGNMGTDKEVEMHFWTLEQYRQFAQYSKNDPIYYYCFEILYWCGLREGEMLALTLKDLDFENNVIDVNKTFHQINGKEYFGEPKTRKSKRKVSMPDFLAAELKEYVSKIYEPDPLGRIFPADKSSITRAMAKYTALAGLPHIRIHDLRHSHVSLLIDMGYSAVAIADRGGHESVEITYRYAHMFPNVQNTMADRLSEIKKNSFNEEEEN